MYHMNVNVDKQRIEIMRQGIVMASQPLPSRLSPKFGDKLMLLAQPGNQEVYDLIFDLVADANDGCQKEA